VARHLKRCLGSSAVVIVFHLHIKFRYCTISLSRRSRPAWSGSSATARQDVIEIKAMSMGELIKDFMLICGYILNERNLEMGKLPVFIAYTPDSIAVPELVYRSMIRKGLQGGISTPCMRFAGPLTLPISQLDLLSHLHFLDADLVHQRRSSRQSNRISAISVKIMKWCGLHERLYHPLTGR
jgi:hypothetical protein